MLKLCRILKHVGGLVRFLFLNSLKFSLNFLLMNEETWLPAPLPVISIFNPLLASLSVWWLFPPVRILQLGYTIFSYASQDDIRFVGWRSSVGVDLLVVQNRAYTPCRNRACIIHWLVHPFHIHDRYSSRDRFYCASLGIHVLPISNNRKLKVRWFPTAIG